MATRLQSCIQIWKWPSSCKFYWQEGMLHNIFCHFSLLTAITATCMPKLMDMHKLIFPRQIHSLLHLIRSLLHLVHSLRHPDHSLLHLVRSLLHQVCSLLHLVRSWPFGSLHFLRWVKWLLRSVTCCSWCTRFNTIQSSGIQSRISCFPNLAQTSHTSQIQSRTISETFPTLTLPPNHQQQLQQSEHQP